MNVRDWPHSPVHRLGPPGAYIITAGTHLKQPFYRSAERLTFLTNTLLELAERYRLTLHAWAVFPNHYHLILDTVESTMLKSFIRQTHTTSARYVNTADLTPNRKVWFQYWETHLTFPKSYLARLNYVHSNAVRHGLARRPETYPWCSAAWFERRAQRSSYRTVMTPPSDLLNVPDDFDCQPLAMECGAPAPPLRSINPI
jgi:putative transposase